MTSSFTLENNGSEIHSLLFDMPSSKVNVFSNQTLDEFDQILSQIEKNPDIKALLIKSKKNDCFIAGADLKEFAPAFHNPELLKTKIDKGHALFRRLSKLPFPTIAVIDGACLGGGLELALACHFRIASDHPKCELALPETTLGIIPGWGGTQRLPRLAALPLALEMILSGKKLQGRAAYKAHLVDALSSREFLDENALLFAKSLLHKHEAKKIKSKRKKRGLSYWFLECNPIGRALLFSQVKKKVLAKTSGFYPAPLKALGLIEKTYPLPLEKGLEEEARLFSAIDEKDLSIAQNLIDLFLAQEKAKKELDKAEKPQTIQRPLILGAGTMGGTLAWLFAKNGFFTRVKEIDEKALLAGLHHSYDLFQGEVKRKKMNHEEASLAFHRLSWTLNNQGLEKADFILESIVEDLAIKKKVLQELEKIVPKEALIVTNTSSLKVDEIAEALQYPERFCGLHFFNPANRMPLVEVVPGKKSSEKTVYSVFQLAKKLGKTPLLVGDCNGFLVNRIFMRAALEALSAFDAGVDIEALDKEMKSYGMPMGSFELIDEVGIDVVYKVANILEKSYGPRMKASSVLSYLYEHKALGKKSGAGFYIWNNEKRGAINPLLKQWKEKRGNDGANVRDVREKIVGGMKEEAEMTLKEGIVDHPWKIDLSLILGTGFPPFRGGLFQFKE
jgi:3-hydroxyacyl-CoA dehydrogenase / enoyl-CoA hydratase / 3-hydroxybutyryl-CoA epimerase